MEFQLSGPLRRGRIDPGRSQPRDVFTLLIRIDYMDGFVAAFQTGLNEGQQKTIFLLVAVEQRADMAYLAEF